LEISTAVALSVLVLRVRARWGRGRNKNKNKPAKNKNKPAKNKNKPAIVPILIYVSFLILAWVFAARKHCFYCDAVTFLN
jgi:hypothetical protein